MDEYPIRISGRGRVRQLLLATVWDAGPARAFTDRSLTAYLVLGAWTVLGGVGFSIWWLRAFPVEVAECGDAICVGGGFALLVVAGVLGPLVATVVGCIGGVATALLNEPGPVRRVRAGTLGFLIGLAGLAVLILVFRVIPALLAGNVTAG
jgi:hypothetical protein